MSLSRIFSPVLHFDDDRGNPLSSGWLCTFYSRTNTPVATYKDASGTLNEVEIQLDSRGECEVWLDSSVVYKFELWNKNKTERIWFKNDISVSSAGSSPAPISNVNVVGDEETIHVEESSSGGMTVFVVSVAQGLIDIINGKQSELPKVGDDYAISITGNAGTADVAERAEKDGSGNNIEETYKTKQTAVTDPTAEGTGLSFIDSVTQNANGEITPHKKTVQDGTTVQKGVVQLQDSVGSTEITTDKAVTPHAVRAAINSAVSSAYHAAGTKTVAQLTSSLLVAENEGCVYNVTDSGTTTSDFVDGAGHPINAGDNVGVCKVGNDYKFDLLSGFVDLSNYVQKSNTAGLLKNDGTVDESDYLTKTGDASNTTSTFTEASGDTSSMTSGGKLSAIFGAISSFFASLKALAFKDTAAYDDLSSDVQSSLDKADTALQSAVEYVTTSSTWQTLETAYKAGKTLILKVENGTNWFDEYRITAVNKSSGSDRFIFCGFPTMVNLDNGSVESLEVTEWICYLDGSTTRWVNSTTVNGLELTTKGYVAQAVAKSYVATAYNQTGVSLTLKVIELALDQGTNSLNGVYFVNLGATAGKAFFSINITYNKSTHTVGSKNAVLWWTEREIGQANLAYSIDTTTDILTIYIKFGEYRIGQVRVLYANCEGIPKFNALKFYYSTQATLPSSAAEFAVLNSRDASWITRGTFGTDRIEDDAITAAKVKDNETLPVNISGNAASATNLAQGGASGQYLKSNGSGNAPSWDDPNNLTVGAALTAESETSLNPAYIRGKLFDLAWEGMVTDIIVSARVSFVYGSNYPDESETFNILVRFTGTTSSITRTDMRVRSSFKCGSTCEFGCRLNGGKLEVWVSHVQDVNANYVTGSRVVLESVSHDDFVTVGRTFVPSQTWPTMLKEVKDYEVVAYAKNGNLPVGSPSTPVYMDSDGQMKPCSDPTVDQNFNTPSSTNAISTAAVYKRYFKSSIVLGNNAMRLCRIKPSNVANYRQIMKIRVFWSYSSISQYPIISAEFRIRFINGITPDRITYDVYDIISDNSNGFKFGYIVNSNSGYIDFLMSYGSSIASSLTGRAVVEVEVSDDNAGIDFTAPAASQSTFPSYTYSIELLKKTIVSATSLPVGSTSIPVWVNAYGNVQQCTNVNADTVDGKHIVVGTLGRAANTIYFLDGT